MEGLEDAMGQMNLEEGQFMEGEDYEPNIHDALFLLQELEFQLGMSVPYGWNFLQGRHDDFYDAGVGNVWEGVTHQLEEGMNINHVLLQLNDYITDLAQSYGGETVAGEANEDRGFDDVEIEGSGVRRLEF